MKLKKTMLLTLLSLSLVGCNPKTEPTPPSSENQGEIKNDDKKDDKTDDKKDDKTDDKTDEKIDDKKDDDTKVDDKKDDPYQSGWPESVVKQMLKYLGNQYIPFVNMGNSNIVSATYIVNEEPGVEPYLKIDGTKEYSTGAMTLAYSTFESAGYILSDTGTGFRATKDTLTVDYINDNGFVYLKVYYDEPYDQTSASDWNDEVKELFSNYLENHEIPYFYMGTRNPYWTSFKTETNTTTIYGRGYDDEMVTKAIEAFSNSDEWDAKEGSYSKGHKTMTATGNLKDGCKITLTLSNMDATNKRAKLDISYKEGFNPDGFTSWTSEIKDIFTYSMDNHSLPVIYLGNNNPEPTYSSSLNTLTIKGGFYDDQFIALAKKALEEDKDANGTSYWTDIMEGSNSYGKTLTASRKDYDDGCKISVSLGGNSASDLTNKCQLVATYIPKISFPSDVNDWSADVKAKLSSKFSDDSLSTALHDHDLPYIYLNTTSETASLTSTYNRFITITGGTFNPNIVTNAISVYKKAGWTISETKSNAGYKGFYATKSFSHTSTDESGNKVEDSSHNCEITVRLDGAADSSKPYDEVMKFYVYYNEGFGLFDYDSYSSGIQTHLTNYFNSFKLPVFYLGSSWIRYSYTSLSNKETFYGGAWDDSLYTSIEETLINDTGWTITKPVLSDAIPTLKAEKDDGENGKVSIEFSKEYYSTYYYAVPKMVIQYTSSFAVPSDGKWSDAIQSAFTSVLGTDVSSGTNVVPYTYLHKTAGTETYTTSAYSNYVRITGGTWDNRIITEADKVYSQAGWETSIGTAKYSKQFQAIKKNSDGSALRVMISKASYSNTASPTYMYVVLDKKANLVTSVTEWDSSLQTKMKTALDNNVLPYIDIGTSSNINSSGLVDTNYNYFYYYGTKSTFENGNAYEAEKVLSNDGWTIEEQYFDSVACPGFIATKLTTNGKIILHLNATSAKSGKSFYLAACYLKDISKEMPSDYEFGAIYLDEMKDMFGIDMPSVYLGLSEPKRDTDSLNYTNGVLKLLGNGYSPTFLSDAKAIFEADKNNNWIVEYIDPAVLETPNTSSYTYPVEEALKAATTNSDGKKVYVYLYQYYCIGTSTTSYIYRSCPVMEIHLGK